MFQPLENPCHHPRPITAARLQSAESCDFRQLYNIRTAPQSAGPEPGSRMRDWEKLPFSLSPHTLFIENGLWNHPPPPPFNAWWWSLQTAAVPDTFLEQDFPARAYSKSVSNKLIKILRGLPVRPRLWSWALKSGFAKVAGKSMTRSGYRYGPQAESVELRRRWRPT